MTAQRQVGGYEWRNELDRLTHIGEQLGTKLEELGRTAPTVDASRKFIELLSLSNQVSVKALKLRNYQVKNE